MPPPPPVDHGQAITNSLSNIARLDVPTASGSLESIGQDIIERASHIVVEQAEHLARKKALVSKRDRYNFLRAQLQSREDAASVRELNQLNIKLKAVETDLSAMAVQSFRLTEKIQVVVGELAASARPSREELDERPAKRMRMEGEDNGLKALRNEFNIKLESLNKLQDPRAQMPNAQQQIPDLHVLQRRLEVLEETLEVLKTENQAAKQEWQMSIESVKNQLTPEITRVTDRFVSYIKMTEETLNLIKRDIVPEELFNSIRPMVRESITQQIQSSSLVTQESFSEQAALHQQSVTENDRRFAELQKASNSSSTIDALRAELAEVKKNADEEFKKHSKAFTAFGSMYQRLNTTYKEMREIDLPQLKSDMERFENEWKTIMPMLKSVLDWLSSQMQVVSSCSG
ncbi:hypothetical protein BT69DRAFT_1302957 [Atractiella rhizophila]|nr:hypothetical protein BT69DRAFT_1302957 [Atractiella rhizophila]